MAQSTILGYPRLGPHRELKTALEDFWKGRGGEADLRRVGSALRTGALETQAAAGISMITSNDFSFYDHVLDMSALLGVVPGRYKWTDEAVRLPTYFDMARGRQDEGVDVPACEMTKWFDTNYHYIVPELEREQRFRVSSDAPLVAYLEARTLGYETRPVLIGPLTYLLLSKDYGGGNPLDHLDALLDAYVDVIDQLDGLGARWVQLDEPALVTDLDVATRSAYAKAYGILREKTKTKIFVTTPFGALGENLSVAANLPIDALHVDLVRAESQLDEVLRALPEKMILAAGVVDGRNIWRNNMEHSLQMLERAATRLGNERLWVAPSCSFLHVPYDLDLETTMDPALKQWLAFTKQKLVEIANLTRGLNEGREAIASALVASTKAVESRKQSPRIHSKAVRERLQEQPLSSGGRTSPFAVRREFQDKALDLPLYPTTTIGSFPQTAAVRQRRAAFKKGILSKPDYEAFLKEEIANCISFQESTGLDVLVHGEFERNDMVEFFGEKLHGFTFTQNGWVQSYGSRGVKPPIIYGDVFRPEPMTVELSAYAQSLTPKPVKGMLTGPVTILQWSFVRDDQPRSATAHQIALALQNEVLDLEMAGMKVIQIDEPAFREGAPLRRSAWREYFDWATQAFRLASTGVRDETQIHTHMCYSEFNDIIAYIRDLDADVISIETSRSQMELLEAFVQFKYPNGIGPGVYDIHSPRVPSEDEIVGLIEKASQRLEPWQIWVNPDCGLKTRDWPETRLALSRMVVAARALRAKAKASV